MAIGANKSLMRKLEHVEARQQERPITAGGRSTGAKLKGSDSDGVKRKVRGGAIQAIRAKKHKFTPGKKSKK